MATVIVRAPWFYGPHQPLRQTQFFAAVRRGRFPLVGDGTQRRSMAYTGNLVHGLLRAEVAEAAPGRAYWIADARPYELREILANRARRARGRGSDRVAPAAARARTGGGPRGRRSTGCSRVAAATSSRCTSSAS